MTTQVFINTSPLENFLDLLILVRVTSNLETSNTFSNNPPSSLKMTKKKKPVQNTNTQEVDRIFNYSKVGSDLHVYVLSNTKYTDTVARRNTSQTHKKVEVQVWEAFARTRRTGFAVRFNNFEIVLGSLFTN